MCTVLMPTGDNAIAVNKYIISYHIISNPGGRNMKCQKPAAVGLWSKACEHYSISTGSFLFGVVSCHRAPGLVSHYNLAAFYVKFLCSTAFVSCLRHCAISRKVAGSVPDGANGIVHWLNFRPRCRNGIDSFSNRNEYQGYLLGGEGGRCLELTTLPP